MLMVGSQMVYKVCYQKLAVLLPTGNHFYSQLVLWESTFVLRLPDFSVSYHLLTSRYGRRRHESLASSAHSFHTYPSYLPSILCQAILQT